MRYQSGERVLLGDDVMVKDKPAFVKFIVRDAASPLGGWYFNQLGPGVIFELDGSGEYYCEEGVLMRAEDITLIGRDTDKRS